MPIKANGTHAKDVALYFIQQTSGRATPHVIAKTISQTKVLLDSGYSSEELMKAIDHVLSVWKIQMYSIGYLNSSIEKVLREVSLLDEKNKLNQLAQAQQSEVKVDSESTNRNQKRADRLGVQSRFGEKFNFDLFEE